MIHVALESDTIVILADGGDLAPRDESQLAFWGFRYEKGRNRLIHGRQEQPELLSKLLAYLHRRGLTCVVDESAEPVLAEGDAARRCLESAFARGRSLKDGVLDDKDTADFRVFVRESLARPLKTHQYKAALHLLATENGANFSVPGSGKTAVVLVVMHRLRQLGEIDSLFVVGPPACFAVWQDEYEAVLGVAPACETLAGGDVSVRRSKYCVNADSVADLYLTTYQTLQRDWEAVRVLFEHQGIRFFFVVDEAHYIKQAGGAWADAVLNVARHAERRCVLTGTPFPRSYGDGFNLFDVLWPKRSPISEENRARVTLYTQKKELERAATVLNETIGPLFYRVRKTELGLAPQVFHDPLCLEMHRYERQVYDCILDRVRDLSQSDYFRNIDLLLRLRRGRMTRLRQCLSYAALLVSAVAEYNEQLLGEDISLSDVIKHYDELEVPAKMVALLRLVTDLAAEGQKVVVWSNFVRTLERIRDLIGDAGIGVGLIYGATPIQNVDIADELTREGIIQDFADPASSMRVLVANPAACGESVSLHKACLHAVYYDLSYNCAQYLQSLDRIHRVGGSENRSPHYHFLQYADTVEADILNNLRTKASNMSRVIDQEYPIYSLDMFGDDDELEAYERLFKSPGGRV